MFYLVKVVCFSLLSFTTPLGNPVYRHHERVLIAPPSPNIYSAPPPSPPPIYIWINGDNHHNYGPRTDDYDGDGA